MIDRTTPDLFLAALSLRDFDRFADCLAPSAQARMLLPPGPETHAGREDIVGRFAGWFAHGSDFSVLDSSREHVGTRSRLSWRFRMSRNGQPPEVIEQVAFVDVGRDGITRIDLLCSGFLPDEQPVQEPAADRSAPEY
jgi:hypothetical protein